MADRQTVNVSLPAAQEEFLRAQVASGRYRSVSEVVRDGLRLLEQAEHRRLLEKWLYQGLSESERASLPDELVARVRAHFTRLLDEGRRSAEEGGWVEGEEAMRRIAERMLARRRKRTA